MTEADYERVMSLLQNAEKELAEHVVRYGDSGGLLGICRYLIEALTLMGVELQPLDPVEVRDADEK